MPDSCTFSLTIDGWGTPARCGREAGHRGPHRYFVSGTRSPWDDQDRWYVQSDDETQAALYIEKAA